MRTGRPKLSPKEKRTRKVHPAMTEAEWKKLEGLAKLAGEHPALTARKLILAGMETTMEKKWWAAHSAANDGATFASVEAAEQYYGITLRVIEQNGRNVAVARGDQKFCEYTLEDGELFLYED